MGWHIIQGDIHNNGQKYNSKPVLSNKSFSNFQTGPTIELPEKPEYFLHIN